MEGEVFLGYDKTMSDFFGLDLGRGSIKLVSLEKRGSVWELGALGEVKSPKVDWISGSEADLVSMGEALRALVQETGIKTEKVVFSLPESEVISRLIPLPPMKESEISAALRYEAETFVPYPMDQVQLDGEVVSKDESGRLLVFAVAARSELIERFLRLMQMAKLKALAIEPPAVALSRMVWQSTQYQEPVLLLDLGEKFSDVTISMGGQVYLTRAIPIGGESFTRAISVNLGLDPQSAEEYKKAYGMEETELEGKIKVAVSSVFASLAEEIKKVMESYRQEWEKKVELLILSGGGARLPGLSEELVRAIGFEVQVANPFLRVQTGKVQVPIDLKEEAPRFSLAVGLALRDLI